MNTAIFNGVRISHSGSQVGVGTRAPGSGKLPGVHFSRRTFLAALGASAISLAAQETATNAPATSADPQEPNAPKIANINDLLEPIRAKNRAPGLTAAVISGGKLAGVGLVGIRKGGVPIPVQRADLWHIGSCTKAMTATLIALQVEKGKMRWDMRIAEVLPELKDAIAAGYRDVTLEQLLNHRSGLPNQPPSEVWDEAWAQRGTVIEQRLAFAKANLARQPEVAAGTKYIYSNTNYTVASCMLERALEQPWEKLMREQLFPPLMMRLVGFGMPGSPGQVDQPWAHKWRNNRLEPQQLDNPPAIWPGGGVHCSIWDFSRFVAFHLAGARGEGRLLKAETFSALHYPPEGDEPYAMGWLRGRPEWADGGYTLTHTGSNTLNFAEMWIAPKLNFAAVAVTNIGDQPGERACADTIQALIAKFAKA